MSYAHDEIRRLKLLMAEIVGAMKSVVDVNKTMNCGMSLENFKAVLAKAEKEI